MNVGYECSENQTNYQFAIIIFNYNKGCRCGKKGTTDRIETVEVDSSEAAGYDIKITGGKDANVRLINCQRCIKNLILQILLIINNQNFFDTAY